jgi:hypothetical protein
MASQQEGSKSQSQQQEAFLEFPTTFQSLNSTIAGHATKPNVMM